MSGSKKKNNKKSAINCTAIRFTKEGWEDYQHWFESEENKILSRINELIKSCQRSPFSGIGKPEPLKGDLSGYWSRRINNEHRLVYQFDNGALTIIQCRYHY